MKLKLTWKIWLLIILLVFSFITIFGIPPSFLQKGVLITSVESNSTAFDQGLRQGQVISKIDYTQIDDLDDFAKSLDGKFNSTENIKLTITTNEGEFILFTNHLPNITVSNIPKSKIKLGLDLAGGSRALVKAQGIELDSSQISDLIDITSNRLNEFGISDVKVVPVSDLEGNNFMLVEIAGATPTDLKDLLSQQGKFEAKIGNDTVFQGGSKDITSVSRNAQDSGIESCGQSGSEYACRFRFTIYLSEAAATRQANITAGLGTDPTNPEYLSQKLDLYLDDKLVDSLYISVGLKGQVTTQISIQGSGTGPTEQDAFEDAQNSMHKLQTILITGSLPYKLEIVKLDTISPLLGEEFTNSIFLAGVVALFVVALIIFIRYRRLKFSLALLLTSISEIILILGVAALIEWNLDLPSIAGILATIGTGLDDLIVVMDESKQSIEISLKQRLKRAFAIILGAYFTSLVALLPLLWAGAGLLKGFAVTTLIGITLGVLITRPAFSDIIKLIGEK